MPTAFSPRKLSSSAISVVTLLVVMMTYVHPQGLVPPDREELLKGLPLDLVSLAEQSGLPSPKQVIGLKNELGLTRDQLKKTEVAEKLVSTSALAKGEEIVQAEEELAVLFSSGAANEKSVRTKLEQIAKARAEYRFIHLQGYLRVKQILTADQLKQYADMRARDLKREN